jgi:hypothetical protein
MPVNGFRVDVYPVGWLAVLRRAWRYGTHPNPPPCGRRQAWVVVRLEWRATLSKARYRDWRAVKNSFNGYLAEPAVFPPGDYRRRCGSGWTKRRALRSLARRLP